MEPKALFRQAFPHDAEHRKPEARRGAPGERMSDYAALHPTYGPAFARNIQAGRKIVWKSPEVDSRLPRMSIVARRTNSATTRSDMDAVALSLNVPAFLLLVFPLQNRRRPYMDGA
jgi:hypothetical protein